MKDWFGSGAGIWCVQFYFPCLNEVSSFLFYFGCKQGNDYYFYKYDLMLSGPNLSVGIRNRELLGGGRYGKGVPWESILEISFLKPIGNLKQL